MKGVTALRRLALPRVAAALVVIATGLTSYLALPSASAQAAPPKLPHMGTSVLSQDPSTDDILFIHGFAGDFPAGQGNNSYKTVPGGCQGTWDPAESYFQSRGWTGHLRTVGYYRGDWQNGNRCNIQFDSQAKDNQGNSITNHQSNCDNYPSMDPLYNILHEGSNNQDLGNIACQLAWYIYNQYSSVGKNVEVIAHSMGGMIIRYALDRVYNQDSRFPPFLYVPTVITFATPHGGIPNPGGAWWACGGCTMLSNIQQGTNGPDYFIDKLLKETVAPMGSPDEPTQWTLMGSYCESFLKGTGVTADAALKFPNSFSGYPAVHKIEYYVVPSQLNNDGCSDPNAGNTWQPGYYHGDYLTDTHDNQDATANTCDNCSFPPNNQATVLHSLNLAFYNSVISIPAAPLAVGRNANGKLELFMRGSDGALWHDYQCSLSGCTGGWSGWSSLGGSLSSDPAVGQNSDGRLEVFAVGAGGDLQHDFQCQSSSASYCSGSWSGWSSLGGSLLAGYDPAVAQNSDGRLEVFAVGAGGDLQHDFQCQSSSASYCSGIWSGWGGLGGSLRSSPAVGRNTDGRLEIFAEGSGGDLEHIFQCGTFCSSPWSTWQTLYGSVMGTPFVSQNLDGRLEIFVHDTATSIAHIWQCSSPTDQVCTTPWSGWASLGSGIESSPVVGRNFDGRLEVFAVGVDGVQHTFQCSSPSGSFCSGSWSGWLGFGGTPAGTPPSVGENTSGSLEVFIWGSDGTIWHNYQCSCSGGWSGWSSLGI